MSDEEQQQLVQEAAEALRRLELSQQETDYDDPQWGAGLSDPVSRRGKNKHMARTGNPFAYYTKGQWSYDADSPDFIFPDDAVGQTQQGPWFPFLPNQTSISSRSRMQSSISRPRH